MINSVVGLQFGDEGKGRFTDLIGKKYKHDYCVRYNGGPNAGHSIEIDGKKYVVHQVPSGIFAGCNCVIANGCVVDPVKLHNELLYIQENGFDISKFILSDKASVILPVHKFIDGCNEEDITKTKLGTTKCGIGPCFSDKANRIGLKTGDFLLPFNKFIPKYYRLNKHHNYSENVDEFLAAVTFLKPFIKDATLLLNEANNILFEGAQSFQLDVDLGTYPFVTASNCISSYAFVSAGIPVQYGANMKVYGVFKAYTTRVGTGSFITMMEQPLETHTRDIGHEWGATTGRPRLCGWLDLPAIKYACMVNGVTDLCLVKGDVLIDYEKIKVCTGYLDKNGNQIDSCLNNDLLEEYTPVYKEFDSWKNCIDDKNFLIFLDFIENYVGTKISLVSYGPEREQYYAR